MDWLMQVNMAFKWSMIEVMWQMNDVMQIECIKFILRLFINFFIIL